MTSRAYVSSLNLLQRTPAQKSRVVCYALYGNRTGSKVWKQGGQEAKHSKQGQEAKTGTKKRRQVQEASAGSKHWKTSTKSCVTHLQDAAQSRSLTLAALGSPTREPAFGQPSQLALSARLVAQRVEPAREPQAVGALSSHHESRSFPQAPRR